MSEPLTLYKLIVLYMLEKVNFPLTNARISDFILEKEYTTYFTLQQAISELIDSGLIEEETTGERSLYRITPEGSDTLSYFGNKISDAIRSDIDAFLSSNQYELRNEVSITADYYKTTLQEYAVRCRVREKDSDLVDLTLTVPDEAQAAAIASNWKKKNQEVYDFLMKELML